MPRGNPWFSAAEQTLPEYVPLPMQELFQAGQVLQNRYDENLANIDAVGTGLASIEARLPGHKEYVSKLSSDYRNKTSELLDKYGGNAADPQFQREFSRIKNQFVNDRNLSTILMANEAAKRNEEIAARMAAEGKLFVNPKGTGVDAQGNIVNDVGQIRGVNTLDNLAKRLERAAATTTEVGDLITNRPALEQAQKEIAQSLAMGSPEFMDLKQAYIDRGMSPDQADNQIIQDIQRLSGEYAVSEKTNIPKLNFERQLRQDAFDRAIRSAQLKASLTPEGQQSSPNYLNITAYTIEGTNQVAPSITTAGTGFGTDAFSIPLFGSSQISQPKEIGKDRILPSGNYHIFSGKGNDHYDVKQGVYKLRDDAQQVGVELPYVYTGEYEGTGQKHATKYRGRILAEDKKAVHLIHGLGDGNSRDAKIFTERNQNGEETGRYYIMSDDNKGKIYVRPQAMMRYIDKEGRSIYRELSREQTIANLGVDNGVFSNEGYSLNSINENDNLYKITRDRLSQSIGRTPTKEEVAPYYNRARDMRSWELHNQREGNPSSTSNTEDLFR